MHDVWQANGRRHLSSFGGASWGRWCALPSTQENPFVRIASVSESYAPRALLGVFIILDLGGFYSLHHVKEYKISARVLKELEY